MDESTTTCAGCDATIPARSSTGRAARKWCSQKCRMTTYYRNHPEKADEQRARGQVRAAVESAKATRPPCAHCGRPVHSVRAAYCMALPCRAVAAETGKLTKRAAMKARYHADPEASARRVRRIRDRFTPEQKRAAAETRQRWREATRRFVVVECANCGGPFETEAKTEDQRRYCGRICINAAISASRPPRQPPTSRYTDLPAEQRTETCGVCSTPFTKKSPAHLWCSSGCAERAKRLRDEGRPIARVATFVAGICLRCGESFVDRWLAAGSSRYCSRRCGSRAATDRRRARERNAFVADVDRAKIFERDNWCCGICGLDVDMATSAPEAMSPSLDHIIPIARGGTHEPANVQLAHFICNAIKSDRPAVAIGLATAS